MRSASAVFVGTGFYHSNGVEIMTWTKPEAEVVAVTMEVTAYVATL